jgi:hypothetical protein
VTPSSTTTSDTVLPSRIRRTTASGLLAVANPTFDRGA